MWQLWETGEVLAEFWWGDLRKKDKVEDLGIYGRVILTLILLTWRIW